MKTSLPVLLALATALAGIPVLSAEPTKGTAGVLSVRNVVTRSGEQILRGASEHSVRMILGSPNTTIADNTWVYNRYHAVEEFADSFGCNTLVITFADNKVIDMHLATPRAQEVFAARVAKSPTPITLAEIAKPAPATSALALPR